MTAFTEPTRQSLSALAGWALSRRANSSPSQDLALGKLRAGCEAVIEHVDDMVASRPPAPAGAKRAAPRRPPETDASAVREAAELIGANPPPLCDAGGSHHFDIKTQVCKGCGRTFLEVMGRQPELMG